LEDFKYNSVNITAFRLVDVESPKVVDVMEQMKKFPHSGKDVLNASSVIMVNIPFHSTKFPRFM
jgi:glutamate receptor, ionotropic, invertebrate